MPLTSRWGSSATTVSQIDWTCDSNNTKPRPLNHSCTSGAVCPPLEGPSNIAASVNPPAIGPTNISASHAVNPPVSGPTGISANIAQFNIAPLSADQYALVATTPTAGTIKYSSDEEALFIYDGTNWHHSKSDG